MYPSNPGVKMSLQLSWVRRPCQ